MKLKYVACFAILTSLAYAAEPVQSSRPESMLRTSSSAAEPTENLRTYVARKIKNGFTPQKPHIVEAQTMNPNEGFSRQRLNMSSMKKK